MLGSQTCSMTHWQSWALEGCSSFISSQETMWRQLDDLAGITFQDPPSIYCLQGGLSCQAQLSSHREFFPVLHAKQGL